MAYFDIDDTPPTPDSEAENRRRVLAAIASSGKPAVLGQPAQPSQPNIPTPRLQPTEAPSLGSTEMFGNKPPALGTPPILPGRPNVMPTREDFPAKPVPTWQKVLGVAAAPFLPNLTTNILGRPQREAERAYQGAVQDYTRPLGIARTQAETREMNARAAALENPPAKEGITPEETTMQDLMTGNNGQPQINPDTGKPFTRLEAYSAVQGAKQGAKPEKAPSFDEAAYQEYVKGHPGATRLQYEAAKTAATQRPEKEPKQLAVTPDGTVVELRPGVKVQPGTKPASKYGEPTPDEQRRADLANNLNENLNTLEEIVNRRPDLFGPFAGRATSFKAALGSGDPDIGALETIKHQIGMAQISAHGMRSAQGIEGAAQSIMNNFKNQPKAMLASINAARNSVKTFTGDVERAKGAQTGPKPGDVEGGFRFKGGNPADKNNWEKAK